MSKPAASSPSLNDKQEFLEIKSVCLYPHELHALQMYNSMDPTI
jgi:hypothetical protein